MTHRIRLSAAVLLGSIGMISSVNANTAATPTPPASTHVAQAPTLEIHGFTAMNIYGANQKFKKNGKHSARHFSNDASDLKFRIAGMTASGLEYGYVVNLESHSGANPTVNQNYAFFNGQYGTLQFGNVVGVEDSMISDAGSLIGATGGFDGGYKSVVNLPAFALRGNDVIGDTGYATKLVLYSPEFEAGPGHIRFGASYTPDTAHRGDADLTRQKAPSSASPGNRTFYPSSKYNPRGLDNIALGVSYRLNYDDWTMKLTGAYVHDKSYISANPAADAPRRTRVRNTSAYQTGMIVGYRMENGHLLEIGGGYLDNGRSRLPKYTDPAVNLARNKTSLGATGVLNQMRFGNSGSAHNLGGAYTMGAYKFALSYQGTKRKVMANQRSRMHVYTGTLDVVPIQGLKLYVEADYIKGKTSQAACDAANTLIKASGDNLTRAPRKNNARVALAGVAVNF